MGGIPGRGRIDEAATRRANRADWDAEADAYQDEHGEFLGDARFVWCPEGVDEADAGLLGDVSGEDVLEVGCGAAQCARWLVTRGARVVGLDLSHRQLQHSRRIDAATGVAVPVVCGTATELPVPDDRFDVVFSAFGALPFVADAGRAIGEVARVLRPGGRFAVSVTHPFRWTMPDDPSREGLVLTASYWDRTPYVERDDAGEPTYVEHHRTMGDWVTLLVDAGFRITGLMEPEWPAGHDRVWGGWGPERGALVPGTAIFTAELPDQTGRPTGSAGSC